MTAPTAVLIISSHRRAPRQLASVRIGEEDTTIASKGFMLEGIEEFCAPDAVSPAQFYEMWSGTADRSAEFKLALAVLEQALDDLEKHRHAHDNKRRRLYRQAQIWVQSNDRRWPYSFVNVCDTLNMRCDRLRTHILEARVFELGEAAKPVAAKLNVTRTRPAGTLGSCLSGAPGIPSCAS